MKSRILYALGLLCLFCGLARAEQIKTYSFDLRQENQAFAVSAASRTTPHLDVALTVNGSDYMQATNWFGVFFFSTNENADAGMAITNTSRTGNTFTWLLSTNHTAVPGTYFAQFLFYSNDGRVQEWNRGTYTISRSPGTGVYTPWSWNATSIYTKAEVDAQVAALSNSLNSVAFHGEQDPGFAASPAAGITTQKVAHWDAAYGYGNHQTAGYASTTAVNELDERVTVLETNSVTSLTGDVTGDSSSNQVVAIRGRPVSSAAPSNGQALVWSAEDSAYKPSIVSASGGAGDVAVDHDTGITTNPPNLAIAMGGSNATATAMGTNTVGMYRAITPAGEPVLMLQVSGVEIGHVSSNGLVIYEGTLELFNTNLQCNVQVYDGSRSQPSVRFISDSDAGFYRRSTGGVYVTQYAHDGVDVAQLRTSGITLESSKYLQGLVRLEDGATNGLPLSFAITGGRMGWYKTTSPSNNPAWGFWDGSNTMMYVDRLGLHFTNGASIVGANLTGGGGGITNGSTGTNVTLVNSTLTNGTGNVFTVSGRLDLSTASQLTPIRWNHSGYWNTLRPNDMGDSTIEVQLPASSGTLALRSDVAAATSGIPASITAATNALGTQTEARVVGATNATLAEAKAFTTAASNALQSQVTTLQASTSAWNTAASYGNHATSQYVRVGSTVSNLQVSGSLTLHDSSNTVVRWYVGGYWNTLLPNDNGDDTLEFRLPALSGTLAVQSEVSAAAAAAVVSATNAAISALGPRLTALEAGTSTWYTAASWGNHATNRYAQTNAVQGWSALQSFSSAAFQSATLRGTNVATEADVAALATNSPTLTQWRSTNDALQAQATADAAGITEYRASTNQMATGVLYSAGAVLADRASFSTNLTLNPTFASNADGWSLSNGATYASGRILASPDVQAFITSTNTGPLVAGRSYLVYFDVQSPSPVTATLYFGGTTQKWANVYTQTLTAVVGARSAAQPTLYLENPEYTSAYVDNFYVKELTRGAVHVGNDLYVGRSITMGGLSVVDSATLSAATNAAVVAATNAAIPAATNLAAISAATQAAAGYVARNSGSASNLSAYGRLTMFDLGATEQGIDWSQGENTTRLQPSPDADATIVLPATSGTLALKSEVIAATNSQPAVGFLYIDSSKLYSLTTNYAKLTNWTVRTTNNMTATASNMTISVSGWYSIAAQVSFDGANTSPQYEFEVFTDNSGNEWLSFERDTSSTLTGSGSLVGALHLDAGTVLDLRAKVSSANDASILKAQFTVHQIR